MCDTRSSCIVSSADDVLYRVRWVRGVGGVCGNVYVFEVGWEVKVRG